MLPILHTMHKTFSMKAEKIAHDGAAEGLFEGAPVRVHAMLPDEEGIVEAHKKHGILVGTLKDITKASSSRKTPEELHFLSCSPWQVMEYPLQVALKRQMISDLFGFYPDTPNAGFTPASQFYGYRTKVEFSFCDREGEQDIPLSLAFHERGGGSRRLALPEGCALASENMNHAALMICERLRNEGYTSRDLKTLIIRESKSDGNLLAILFAKKMDIPEFSVEDIPNLSGFLVFYSTEKSPASVPTKGLWGVGEKYLTETIDGTTIRYSWDSFFQNNIPVFEETIKMMRKELTQDAKVLELYAGAGTIGLLLANGVKEVKGIEIAEGAVEAANMNARINSVANYQSECLPAEKIDASLLEDADILLLDPPRVGLHPKLLEDIKEKLPKKIIYLSCNPETQSRDYSELKEYYRINLVHGFDFYPQTPHVETLLVLSLKSK